MALLAVAGMIIPLVAGVAGFIKDELIEETCTDEEFNLEEFFYAYT